VRYAQRERGRLRIDRLSARADDNHPPLRHGEFPQLSIIKTVHFERVPNKR
jgi:hypothetical protein